MPNEKPILFSGPMVRAILAGVKTQTRRVVKKNAVRLPNGDGQPFLVECPYGVPGDRLWVRETFRLRADQDDKPPSQDWWKSGAWYQADGNCEPSGCGGGAGKLRPAIFMPRWASRITLEITEVRAQRLQDMDYIDAYAEGIPEQGGNSSDGAWRVLGKFRDLWNSINGKTHPWESNPWVWALTFRRIA